MIPKNILIYGAGGHGKLVADVLLARNELLEGFVDDNPATSGSTILGLNVFTTEWLWQQPDQRDISIVLGVGNNRARKAIAERCRSAGMEILTVIHPTAVIAASAHIGEGAAIMAAVVVNPEAKIGTGVILNSGAVVEHDVVLGEYSHVSTNVAMGGNARLGDYSMLGVGAAMKPGARVGADTIVGAGSVVVQDIPGGVVAVGVPARVIRSLAAENPKTMSTRGAR